MISFITSVTTILIFSKHATDIWKTSLVQMALKPKRQHQTLRSKIGPWYL